MKDYLTVVEFAAAGITKQAVYKRIKQDLAPYVKSKTEKRLYQNSGHEKDVTIEWIVLDVKANVALLVSKNVLEAIPYHSEQKKVDSEKSSIRSWLNSDFFFAAFITNVSVCFIHLSKNSGESHRLSCVKAEGRTGKRGFQQIMPCHDCFILLLELYQYRSLKSF